MTEAEKDLAVESARSLQKRLRMTLERQEGGLRETRRQLEACDSMLLSLTGQPALPLKSSGK